MDLWIPITFLAASSQTIRTAIQRHMKGQLGDYGASAIRFIYAIPFAWAWFMFVLFTGDTVLPKPNMAFLIWLIIGGITQILFTVLLIKLFTYKNFLVGIAFSKTEVLIAAILEAIVFSVVITAQFAVAILFGIIAVILLSVSINISSLMEIQRNLISKSTFIGLTCGTTLAVSVISFRTAINNLADGDFLIRASATAAIAVILQAVSLAAYMYFCRRAELLAVVQSWRAGLATGLFGAMATAGWFTAFAIHNAAPVRAVGQVEIILGSLITVFIFHQRISRIEVIGAILLVGSILLVIFN